MDVPKSFKPKKGITKKTEDLLEGKIKKFTIEKREGSIEEYTLHDTELGKKFFMEKGVKNPIHGDDFYFNSYLERYGFTKENIKDMYITSYAGNPDGILHLVAVKYKDEKSSWNDFSTKVSHKCIKDMRQEEPLERVSYAIRQKDHIFLIWSKHVKNPTDVLFFFNTFHQQFIKNRYTHSTCYMPYP